MIREIKTEEDLQEVLDEVKQLEENIPVLFSDTEYYQKHCRFCKSGNRTLSNTPNKIHCLHHKCHKLPTDTCKDFDPRF